MKLIKWMREHRGWFWAIVVSGLLLAGATIFLLIFYREAIFTSSTLAIVILVLLAFLMAGIVIFSMKVLDP